MKIFEYSSYKKFLHDWTKNNKRGESTKISQALKISTTLLSQVLKGTRDFTKVQSLLICEYFGFSDLERDYFMTLVDYEKAGNFKLEQYLKAQLEKLKEQSLHVDKRLSKAMTLSEEEKGIFYSNWYFSAIRLLCSIEGFNDINSISNYFNLEKDMVREVIKFLIKYNLIKETKKGYEIGPSVTHIPNKSILIGRHHNNWRTKVLERSHCISEEELMFTSPLTVSKGDFKEVRKILLETIERISKIVEGSPPEQFGCFNLDWIKF